MTAVRPDEGVILARMVALLAAQLGVSESEVDADAPLASLGLDSLRAFSLTGDLAEWLDRELPATLLWEHDTLRSLARSLAEGAASEEPAGREG